MKRGKSVRDGGRGADGEGFTWGLINVNGDSKNIARCSQPTRLGSELPLKLVLFNVGFDYKASLALYTHIKRALKVLKN